MELPAGRLRLSHGPACALMYSGRASRRQCLLQLEVRVTHNGLHELVPDLEHGCKLPLIGGELRWFAPAGANGARSTVLASCSVQHHSLVLASCSVQHHSRSTTVLSWHVFLCCAPAASYLTDFSPLSLVTVYHVKV